MKLDALITFNQASYHNMKSYFKSKLIEHNKNKMKNRRKQNFEGEANNMQLDKEDTRQSN